MEDDVAVSLADATQPYMVQNTYSTCIELITSVHVYLMVSRLSLITMLHICAMCWQLRLNNVLSLL